MADDDEGNRPPGPRPAPARGLEGCPPWRRTTSATSGWHQRHRHRAHGRRADRGALECRRRARTPASARRAAGL